MDPRVQPPASGRAIAECAWLDTQPGARQPEEAAGLESFQHPRGAIAGAALQPSARESSLVHLARWIFFLLFAAMGTGMLWMVSEMDAPPIVRVFPVSFLAAALLLAVTRSQVPTLVGLGPASPPSGPCSSCPASASAS
jgi:hypothetical protein